MKNKFFRRNPELNIILMAFLVILVSVALSGCAQIQNWMNNVREGLVGSDFTIIQYDHFGEPTMRIHGASVAVGLLENESNLDVESTGFESEVLELTVDRNQVFTVGDTCIIAEDGLDLVTDFSSINTDIDAADGLLAFISGDRLVNNFRNSIGKEMVVIIKSQMGVPIGIYQGDDVYVSIPDDLPKTTQLTIDGKQLYIHRANYTIVERDMLDDVA